MPTTPDAIPFDPARPYTSRSSEENRGCPPGYFAQYVAVADDPNAVALEGNPYEGLRCRLIATTTVSTLEQESQAWERTLDNLNAALTESPWPWWWWIAAGALALLLLSSGRSRRSE